MIEAVAAIWQRVLRQPSIGVTDNFFDLGGDSSLAVALFHEIAQVLGKELPPVMIYEAPTVAALAALLEQRNTPRLPPLLLLKDGTAEPPIFITHGLGGSVMDFYQVVRHIQSPHPIYGMQARGIDGVEEPFERIEDMAEFYLDAIRQLQPRGPYILIGYSIGGLVTLEMAQRLSEKGEEVALLVLLDAYPHARYQPLGQRVACIVRKTGRRALALLRPLATQEQVVPYQAPSTAVMQHMRDSAYRALARYRPRFYRGKINFVKAEIATDFPANAAAVWAHLADEFEVDTVPGDHLGIMTTHFESLASVLSRHLRGAQVFRDATPGKHRGDAMRSGF
jgi:thioesterase domain-containing protein/acyl carrier protein